MKRWTTEEMIIAHQISAMFWLKDLHRKSRTGDIARGNLRGFLSLLEHYGNAAQKEQAKALQDLLDGKPEGSFNGVTYTEVPT
jgi:hypothetical protein